MTDSLTQLALDLERELRLAGLWDSEPPATTALLSTAPFCHDTLLFQQWLQWVLLPNIHEIIAGLRPSPTECNIAPLAEMSFLQINADCSNIVTVIRRIDIALSSDTE